MKHILVAAASLAAMGFAGAVYAADSSTTVLVTGTNPPQCNVTGDPSVTLSTNSISLPTGFVNPALASTIAAALNSANIVAWCSGNANGVVLSRVILTTGGGGSDSGFAKGALFDLEVAIVGATRTGYSAGAFMEGTSDGPGNGPGAGVGIATPVSAFGPAGNGAVVSFQAEGSGNVSAVTDAAGFDGPTGSATTSAARLLAGAYQGSVTLTLSPGV